MYLFRSYLGEATLIFPTYITYLDLASYDLSLTSIELFLGRHLSSDSAAVVRYGRECSLGSLSLVILYWHVRTAKREVERGQQEGS